MKHLLLLISILFTGIIHLVGQGQSSKVWIEKAEASELSNHVFYLYNDTMAGKPDIVPLFMHNFNPNGVLGKYVTVKQGVYFSNNNWRIFNQDKSDFVENSYYNLWVPGTEVDAFSHATEPANIFANQTILDHPALNGNPNAIAVISSKWDGYYDELFQGLYYTPNDNRWRIYNEGGLGESMLTNRHFHIAVADEKSTDHVSFIAVSDANNTSGHVFTLNHPDLNNNPGAMLFATHVYNPGGGGSGVYNNHPVGVYYHNGTWRIYNEDLIAMAPGTAFNIIAFPQAPVATNIDEPLKTTDVTIFPNPAPRNGLLQVELESVQNGSADLTVFTMIGERIYHTQLTTANGRQIHTLELRQFERGMYLVKVEQGNQISVQKLVVQ